MTLAGGLDYLTLSGQEITLNTIDISDDTNLVAGTNLTLSGDTLNVDDAFLLNTGDTGTGDYDLRIQRQLAPSRSRMRVGRLHIYQT